MAFSAIVTIVAFGIMIMLHEAGHLFMAKRFGVTVHEFSIGVGPLLFKWGKKETQYSLRLLPLGGYVKLEGEEDSDNPKAFSNISPLKRIGVLVAGAVMNLLLGFMCFVVINNVVGGTHVPTIMEVLPSSAAEEAGLMAGDEIIRLDNTRVYTQNDVRLFMIKKPENVKVTFVRDGEKKSVNLSPRVNESGEMLIGFVSSPKLYSFLETFEYAYYDTRYVIKAVMISLKMLLTGEVQVSDMSGPVGVVQVVEDTTEQVSHGGWLLILVNLLNIFAMISVNLGIFNLLPIPALDGGSIIFNLIELVTRKKLKDEVLGYINLVGLILLFGLGIFVMFSDIMKLI